MQALAPIILFAYNRPEHTRKTLLSLKENFLANESSLFIYLDGPKPGATPEQVAAIEKVKQVVREQLWCKDVTIRESETNKGLAASIIEGVTQTVNAYGKVIVLEDDLVSDKWFLKFMNDALNAYETDANVACITGYIYPVKKALPETFFMKGADCWGWGTWKRAWDGLDLDGRKLLKELQNKGYEYDFNFYDTYPYIPMLKDQIHKKNNSWAILWYASAYLQGKYTLYPGHSLINNIGVDGSGTHSGVSDQFEVQFVNREIEVKKITVTEHKEAKKIVSEYFREIYSSPKKSLLKRIFEKFRN